MMCTEKAEIWTRVHHVYRITEHGSNPKNRLPVDKLELLKEYLRVAATAHDWLTVLVDNSSADFVFEVDNLLKRFAPTSGAHTKMLPTTDGNALGFARGLTIACEDDVRCPVFSLVEDDYLHRPGIRQGILEVLNSGFAEYATGYTHPDKFLPANLGGNPFIPAIGGETSPVVWRGGAYWMRTNSTTCTFWGLSKVLNVDAPMMRNFSKSGNPDDFPMWVELGRRGRRLAMSIPPLSTHTETAWLAKGVDWEAMT